MSVIDLSPAIRTAAQRLRQFGRYSIGRILGTVTSTKGSYKFMIDLVEAKLFMRAELNAITKILLDKKIVTPRELQEAMLHEYNLYFDDLQKHWPEVKVAEDGMSYSLDLQEMQKRVKEEGWPL